jgi:uncharacterized membrane protein YeaQ/YmgE (transglycosylase-associated protein family)
MTLIELLILLLIAAVVGFIAQSAGGYWRGGLVLAIVLGFVGALVGSSRRLGCGVADGLRRSVAFHRLGHHRRSAVVGLASPGGRRWGAGGPIRSQHYLMIAILLAVSPSWCRPHHLDLRSAYTLMAIAFGPAPPI